MIDFGSSHCFLDEHYVKSNHFPIFSVLRMRLRLIDGSTPSFIMCTTLVPVWFPGGATLQIRFLLTKLDSEFPAVLGLDWLTQHNLLINWADSSVTFREHLDIRLVSDPVPEPTMVSVPASSKQLPDPTLELPSDDDSLSKASDTPTENLFKSPTPKPWVEDLPKSEDLPDLPPPILSDKGTFKTPHISLVFAKAFMRSLQSEGAQCFSISVHCLYEATCAAASSSSSCSNSDPNLDLEGVPHFYHEFSDIFSKKKADTLAPHQDCDFKIEIDETAKPPLGPIYSLLQSELTALWEFIDENVANGFIQPSNSPFGAPVLCVKKKDSSLHLCVDFCRLNAITWKDKYPLPLISDLLDSPCKAKIFTKINLKHAYHLVCIAAGDEWKTAFCTHYGSFEWLVMPLGLTNAPGGFQQFLNTIFADL